jgi:inhibitor of KinA
MMPRIVPMSEYALTIEFGDGITLGTNERVLAAYAIIDQAALPGVGEVVPTYRSATVYFDPLQTDAITLTGQIQALLPHNIDAPTRPATTHIIPVWYGGAAGPDLPDVAQQADLTPIDAGRLHASVTYRVYMLGFSPGFPYLGTVPTRIATPRHPTPRRQVAAGSVGIAGTQTGIYPQTSPGGWRIIGRTPVRLFSLTRAKPFLLEPGDSVRFVPIDEDEFARLSLNRI